MFDYSSHIFKQLNQSDLKEILFIHSHTIETMNNENHPSFGLKHAPDVVLDYVKLKKAARILKSVNLSFPRRVIDLLQEQGPMSSVDIMITLRVDQAYLRTHLNNLKRSNLLVIKPDWNNKNCYHVNYDQLEKVANAAKDLANGYNEH